jgi:hypothetical protein
VNYALIVAVLVAGCALLSACSIVVTNAPSSLGNCMPDKPAGGCP